MLMLSPRPPTRPKISHARHSGPEGEHSESTESVSGLFECIIGKKWVKKYLKI